MMTSKLSIKIVLTLCIVAALSACSGKKKKNRGIDASLTQQKVEELYNTGKRALDRGNYQFAIQFYRALEAAYPYGPFTEQAKLDIIYAFDKSNQVESAVQAADNFIKLYPTHKNIDYAYYMKGVASFEKKSSRFDKMIKGSSKTIRDPKPVRDSQDAFEELLKRYPNSKYAEDAKLRLVFIENTLAKRELSVAQFYYNNRTYVAAVNRCKNIIYQYERSPSVEGALVLMEKAYVKMGLDDLAESTRDVLVANFPEQADSKGLKKKRSGLLGRINPF